MPEKSDVPKADPNKPGTANTVVTYNGPTDPADGTTEVIVPFDDPRRDETFALDQPVRTTKSTADRLARMEGHKFTIEPAEPEGAK